MPPKVYAHNSLEKLVVREMKMPVHVIFGEKDFLDMEGAEKI